MCAAVAGQRGRQVLVLEQARQPGEKIRISGGGRCNFTNLHTSPANFLSGQSALLPFGAERLHASTISSRWSSSYGIAYHEKTRGQLFCDGSSRQIIDMLLEECRKAHAQVAARRAHLGGLRKAKTALSSLPIRANFAAARWWSRPAVRRFRKWERAGSATRSPSSSALRSCRRAPALVPLTFDAALLAQFKDLSGVSVDAVVSCGKTQLRRGAAVHPSRAERSGDPADIVLLAGGRRHRHRPGARRRCPGRAENSAPRSSQAGMATALGISAEAVGADRRGRDRRSGAAGRFLRQAADAGRVRGAAVARAANGTEGYRTAEVTLGGVDTSELSSKTFEARSVPGLYFIGEVVDCHRSSWRVQFSMGVVVGGGGGEGSLAQE